jgi:hypothetical protein
MLMLTQAISTIKVLDYAIAINWLSVFPCKVILEPFLFLLSSIILIELAEMLGKGEISST